MAREDREREQRERERERERDREQRERERQERREERTELREEHRTTDGGGGRASTGTILQGSNGGGTGASTGTIARGSMGGGIGAPTGTIPPGSIGGGGSWDLVNRFDAVFVAEGRKHNVPPAMLKSMMIVETGGVNVDDRFGATGVMQIKPIYWGDRAREAGYDLATDAGQIGMAAAILGGNVPNVRGDDPTERFLYTYYPVLNSDGSICYDCKGESGHTPRMYLNDIALYTGLIEAAAPVGDGSLALGESGLPAGATPLQRIQVAGFAGPVWLQEDIAFSQNLTPLDAEVRPNDTRPGANRSGLPMRAMGTRYHETGNTNVGTDAAMHARWQNSGTPGHPDGRVGVHFYVDDNQVVQTLPVDEQGIHSGDNGNQIHIAVEQCVNSDADLRRARRNAICLHAALLRDVLNTTAAAAMWRHHDGWGCPATINGDGTWGEVESETDRLIRQGTG